MELVFEDVKVTVDKKTILHDIYGVAKAGQLTAIMGPSGGGKTTLLNTLAGRMPLESGEITFNGVPLSKGLKRQICYVLQEDIFFPNLTLRETLTFTAMLRLPDRMPAKEKLRRMDEIIDELDIRKCLDTLVGDAWTRGLSGGEKKRANIACELITDPMMILMDEPTSGLDYSTALSLVMTLKTYAEHHNKNVVTTIHQPSSQIFLQFHRLLLLCDGKVAYSGEVRQVADFFASIGLPIEPLYNPADFILEKLKESEETKQKIIEAAQTLRYRNESERPPVEDISNLTDVTEPLSPGQRKTGPLAFLHRWRSPRKPPTRPIVKDSAYDPGSVHLVDWENPAGTAVQKKWPTGFWTQYRHLTVRTFRNSRSRILGKLKLVESAALCILVSLIWFQLPRLEETLRDRMGVLFFVSINWGFTPLFDAVSSFPMERVVIHKERSAGWYRLSAYYLAKLTSELPLNLIKPLVFLTVVYPSVGLHGVGAYFASLVTIIFDSFAGQSIGLFLGICSMDFQKSATLATIIMMSIMLLGGFYTRNLPFWLDWIKYLSFINYTFHSLVFLEFSGAPSVQCSADANASQFVECLALNTSSFPADLVLKSYGITGTFWQYFLPLFLFIAVFWTLGYVVLRFFYRPH